MYVYKEDAHRKILISRIITNARQIETLLEKFP